MRYELETFFSNPCESSGLLIAEAPTGYGKTYETIQAIYRYIEKGGKSQILFITNLLKNLPDDELRNIYEQNGRGALFKKEVLVLSSVASNVEKVILTEKIPPEFQTDAYQELLSACQKKKQYQQQFGEAGKDITKHMGDQIREKLEPQFRRELEVHLQKTFPGGPGPRRDAIRNKEKYKWMATFYPAIFWTEYKVLLLSVKKLMARNIPLVEPSFDCLSERMLKNKIVCIDEFDASRSVILDRHCYFYAQKGDFSEIILSCGQDKMQFAASLPEGLFPSTVSEEEARLAQILSYPGLKEHFINHGWATEFGTGPYIMSPVLFQNIYKGALGEVAGKFILEKELGLILQEIEDPEKFESFDFVTDGDVFFDFKHWKWNMQVEESPMRAKVLKKLDAVGGKKAFIVNLFSDGVSRPSCSNDGRLIEVPGILLPTGQLDQPALDYIRRFLL